MQFLIAHSLLPNYIDPQKDKKVGVNKIPTIFVKRISAAKKVQVIVNRLRPWRMFIKDLALK